MAFDPKVGQEIIINGVPCHFAEHPAARGFVFGQEGRAATVYRLDSELGSVAENDEKMKKISGDYGELG